MGETDGSYLFDFILGDRPLFKAEGRVGRPEMGSSSSSSIPSEMASFSKTNLEECSSTMVTKYSADQRSGAIKQNIQSA